VTINRHCQTPAGPLTDAHAYIRTPAHGGQPLFCCPDVASPRDPKPSRLRHISRFECDVCPRSRLWSAPSYPTHGPHPWFRDRTAGPHARSSASLAILRRYSIPACNIMASPMLPVAAVPPPPSLAPEDPTTRAPDVLRSADPFCLTQGSPAPPEAPAESYAPCGRVASLLAAATVLLAVFACLNALFVVWYFTPAPLVVGPTVLPTEGISPLPPSLLNPWTPTFTPAREVPPPTATARDPTTPDWAYLGFTTLSVFSAVGVLYFYGRPLARTAGSWLLWLVWLLTVLCTLGLLLSSSVSMMLEPARALTAALPAPLALVAPSEAAQWVAALCAAFVLQVGGLLLARRWTAPSASPQPGHSLSSAALVMPVSPSMATATRCPCCSGALLPKTLLTSPAQPSPPPVQLSQPAESLTTPSDALTALLTALQAAVDRLTTENVALRNSVHELQLTHVSREDWTRVLRSCRRSEHFLKALRRVPPPEGPSPSTPTINYVTPVGSPQRDPSADSQPAEVTNEDLAFLDGSSSSSSSSSSSGDESSCTSSKKVTIKRPPAVNTVLATQKKVRGRRPTPAHPLTPEQRQQAQDAAAAAKTIEDLKESLKKLQKKLDRRSRRLSEEEKQLRIPALLSKWADERREARSGPTPDVYLTDDEKQMTRADIRRKLSLESNLRWAQRQQDRGRSIERCETCGRFREPGDNHFCARAPWVGPTQYRSGVPTHQELVVTGSPTGFNVQRKTTVDLDQLSRQWEAMNKVQQRFAPPVQPVVVQAPAPTPTYAQVITPAYQPVVLQPNLPATPQPLPVVHTPVATTPEAIPRKTRAPADRPDRPDIEAEREKRRRINALLSSGAADHLFPEGRPPLLKGA